MGVSINDAIEIFERQRLIAENNVKVFESLFAGQKSNFRRDIDVYNLVISVLKEKVAKDINVPTNINNADNIRCMNDNELVSFLSEVMHSGCFGEGFFPYHPCPDASRWSTSKEEQKVICEACGLEWLRSEAHNEETQGTRN